MMISPNQYFDDSPVFYRNDATDRSERRRLSEHVVREISPEYVPEIFRQKLVKALLPTKNNNFAVHFETIDAFSGDQGLSQECSEPPSAEALARAREILARFEIEKIEPTRIVASIEGGLAICFVASDRYADVECLNSGGILAVTTNRRNHPNVWEIDPSPDGIARAVAQIRDFYVGTTTANDAQRKTG